MIKTFVLFLALSAVVSGKLQHPITRTIDTNYGQVRGIHETSLLTEKSYYSFRGIPYAKPPIGDLRFKVIFKMIMLPVLDFLQQKKRLEFYAGYCRRLNPSIRGIRMW